MRCDNFVAKTPGPIWGGALCVCGAQKKAHVTKAEPKPPPSTPGRASTDRASSTVASKSEVAKSESSGSVCKVDSCVCPGFEPNQWSAKKCAICLHTSEDHVSASPPSVSASSSVASLPAASSTFSRLALRQAVAAAPAPSSSSSFATPATPARFRAPSLPAAPTATSTSAPSPPATTTAATPARTTPAVSASFPPATSSATTSSRSVAATQRTPVVNMSSASTTAATATASTSFRAPVTSIASTTIATPTITATTTTTTTSAPTLRAAAAAPSSSAATTTTTTTTTTATPSAPITRSGFRAPSIVAVSPSAFSVSNSTVSTATTVTSSATLSSSPYTTPSSSPLLVPIRTPLRASVTNANLASVPSAFSLNGSSTTTSTASTATSLPTIQATPSSETTTTPVTPARAGPSRAGPLRTSLTSGSGSVPFSSSFTGNTTTTPSPAASPATTPTSASAPIAANVLPTTPVSTSAKAVPSTTLSRLPSGEVPPVTVSGPSGERRWTVTRSDLGGLKTSPSASSPSFTTTTILTSIATEKHLDAEYADLENELQTEKRANAALSTQLELQKQETAIVERTLTLQDQQRIVLVAQVENLEKRHRETEQQLLTQRRKTDEISAQVNHLLKEKNDLEETLSLERVIAAKVDSVKSRETILMTQANSISEKQTNFIKKIEGLEIKLREAEYALTTQQQVNEDLLVQNKDLQLSVSHTSQLKKQEQIQQQQRTALMAQVSELDKKLRDTEHALTLSHRKNEEISAELKEIQQQRLVEARAMQQDLQRQEGIINEGRKYDQQREMQFEEMRKKLQEGEELQAVQQQLNEELIAQLNEIHNKGGSGDGVSVKYVELEKKLKESTAQMSHEIFDLRESLAARDRDLEDMSAIFDQMSKEKDGTIESLQKEISQLQKGKQESGSSEPPSTGLRSRTSLLLTDAANYFQANLEVSKKDFRIEQLEGLLAKAEMDAQSKKHKCDQITNKYTHLEQEHNKLIKAKEATNKELSLLTRELTGLRNRLASGEKEERGADSDWTQATVNELERESLFEEFENAENTHAQQLMDLTVLVTNLKDTLPKLKQEISALCNCLQGMITLQVACAKGLKEARQRGEKQAMGFLASHISAMDRNLMQYVALLSVLRMAGFQEEINRVDNSRIELPLAHPEKIATFLQTLKDQTSTQLPGYELISSTCHFCQTKANAIQKAQEHARQSAAVSVLQTKIHAIPDDFLLTKNSRVLQDEALMWYILQQTEEKHSLTHPTRTKEAESVRVFLFNDTLLITTLEYKYRYRLELQDTQISPANSLRLVLKADLFTDDDIKLNNEDDLVWPEVPIWESIEANTPCYSCLTANKARHNCRLCGQGFCAACSIKVVVPPRFEQKNKPNKKKSRVCLNCDETTKRNLDLHGERGAGLLTTSDSAGAITVLQCNSTAERDMWVLKIRTTVETRKHEVGQKLVEKGKRQSILLRNPEQGFSEGVRVFLRVRPFVLDIEKETGEICLSFEDNVARLEQKSLDEWRADRVGYYDNIWGPECTQSDVYKDAGRPVVAAILSGVNCAVMCYGNTGSGKTYTMTGIGNSAKSGLLPRILEALLTDKPDCTVTAKMAYVQVYNGRVEDLLRTRAEQPLELVKDKSGRYSNMYFCPILNVNQAMMSLIKSQSLRATRSHNMNDLSSRSHALCILQVKVVPKSGGKPREAMLQLVDLAGSENTISTGVDRDGGKEAIEINKSLISLGRVVHALNENTKRTKGKTIVVPFRESPLTIILRDVLEKECLCHVVLNCSCSPALQQARQTAKTMAFGDGLRKLAGNQKSS